MTAISEGAPRAGARYRELPAGLGDLLPATAARFLDLRHRCISTLQRWGYRPVVVPLMEYVEVFTRAQPEPEEGATYRLVDRDTGHVLAVRPDFTPQVARLAGTRFADAPLPLRLCYEGPVLRHVPARRGRSRELHQVGAEFLGVRDPEADAEAVAVVIACLRACGLEGFKIDLGQVEFFRGILGETQLAPEQRADLTSAVARKDLSELEGLLEQLPIAAAHQQLLRELPLLAGGPEVLDRAAPLVVSDHSRRALDNLAAVVELVGSHGLQGDLTVDLGDIRGIDYHTGVIFEAFVHQLGTPLCRGGRYDGLPGRYGRDLPATGFSLDLLGLLDALRLQGPVAATPSTAGGVFLINFAPDRGAALDLARRLREAGVRAARDLVRRPLEASLDYARGQGYRWATVFPADRDEDAVQWIDLDNGAAEPLTAVQVVRRATGQE